VVLLVLLTMGVSSALAQRGGYGYRNRREPIQPNPDYDGRFSFVRIRYGPDYGFVSQGLPWSHDYPTGEQHFMKILNELSYLNAHVGRNEHPAARQPGPVQVPGRLHGGAGFLTMTDAEVAAFRGICCKGGFVIFDDFAERRGGWDNFEMQMRRVLPEGRFVDLDASNPIFHAFFEIPNLDIVPQYYDTGKPIFAGFTRTTTRPSGCWSWSISTPTSRSSGSSRHRTETDRRIERSV
jgi:hypothetical protein